jgi:hypothetical protein
VENCHSLCVLIVLGYMFGISYLWGRTPSLRNTIRSMGSRSDVHVSVGSGSHTGNSIRTTHLVSGIITLPVRAPFRVRTHASTVDFDICTESLLKFV